MHYKTNISNLVKDIELRQDPVIITVNKFTEETARDFQTAMCAAQNSGQKVVPVEIDSYGGEVYSLLSMISSIKNSSIPVATVIQGKAMSCGAILASFGTKGYRYMDPDATMMIHDISSGAWGKIEDLKSEVREVERLQDKVFKMMSENCDKEPNYFVDLIAAKGRADWFLEAEEAIKHGIVDHCKVPVLEINVDVEIDLV
jgi:ATP-dependent Clp protease protease subunit